MIDEYFLLRMGLRLYQPLCSLLFFNGWTFLCLLLHLNIVRLFGKQARRFGWGK